MEKYLILVSGTTKNNEPVSATVHAGDISIAGTYFSYWNDWKRVNLSFEDYQILNILWQSDGFCGHLAKINMGKE